MISMALTLGAPDTRAGGQGGPQHVDRALARAQPARHLGREVHDVAVALQRHQLVDRLGAELDHPAHVVAGQVDQHHVLGPLLGVLGQLAPPGGGRRPRCGRAGGCRRWAGR